MKYCVDCKHHILLAFWDGKSRGTKHMIDFMTSLDKPVRVIEIGNRTL